MGGNFPRFSSCFRQTLDLFDTCILWLVGIGSQRGERKWAYCRGLDLFVFAMCRVVLICLSGISFFLSLMVVWKYNKTGLCLFLPCKNASSFLHLKIKYWRVGKVHGGADVSGFLLAYADW